MEMLRTGSEQASIDVVSVESSAIVEPSAIMFATANNDISTVSNDMEFNRLVQIIPGPNT